MSELSGQKHDKDKVRMELLSVPALQAIAEVMTFGARKYAAHNWRKGFEWSRLYGAALRHLTAHMSGENKDPESGLSHLAHLGCCVMFLLEHEACGLGKDDRYVTAESTQDSQSSSDKREVGLTEDAVEQIVSTWKKEESDRIRRGRLPDGTEITFG